MSDTRRKRSHGTRAGRGERLATIRRRHAFLEQKAKREVVTASLSEDDETAIDALSLDGDLETP